MTLSVDEIKQRLHAVGLKSTVSRVSILQYISAIDRPISHSELVQDMGTNSADQATMYRNLLSFVQHNILRVASTAGGIARYEMVREGEDAQHVHPHFVCSDCGTVSCLPKTTVITSVDERWREILHASQLQFVGKCTDCRMPSLEKR